MDPVGMLLAGYSSGPSNKGVTCPVASAICFKNSDEPVFLTVSHALENPPVTLSKTTGIQPKFKNWLVGINCGEKIGFQLFIVKNSQELVAEVTALFTERVSTDGFDITTATLFPVSSDPIKQLFPVHMYGYPASIQSLGLEPDADFMEVASQKQTAFHYAISGVVTSYYEKIAPYFIDRQLLPAFLIDNAVLPGMSGGAIALDLKGKRAIVGIIVKNCVVTSEDRNSKYDVVHTLGISLHDIEVP